MLWLLIAWEDHFNTESGEAEITIVDIELFFNNEMHLKDIKARINNPRLTHTSEYI